MALKILIPGIDFPVNNPEKPDNSTPKTEPPPIRPAVHNQKETLTREQISTIEAQALAIGWEPEQLDELAGVMKVFMPCRVGIIRPEVIGILLLDANGEIRGGNSFYNMRTEQP